MTNQTELETAKKLFEEFEDESKEKDIISQHTAVSIKAMIKQHLRDCKRWLSFLREYQRNSENMIKELSEIIVKHSGVNTLPDLISLLNKGTDIFKNKISDLQDAIKFYEGKGIQ